MKSRGIFPASPDRRPGYTVPTMKYTLLLALLLLAGCGGVRLSDAQAVHLAQGREDAEAARAWVISHLAEVPGLLGVLVTATADRLKGALAEADGMPKPEVSVGRLLGDQAVLSHEAGESAAAGEHPAKGTGGGEIGLYLAGAGVLLLGALKVFTPVAGQVAELVWQAYATRDQKNAQKIVEKSHEIVSTASEAASLFRLGAPDLYGKLPPTIKALIDQTANAQVPPAGSPLSNPPVLQNVATSAQV